MRLSDLLSKAPAHEEAQVEGFLGSRRVGWGQHRLIEVGKIALNFHCQICAAPRTFLSEKKLSCLVVGEQVVSIDACLKCSGCEKTVVEAWFLVVSRDNLYDSAPTVRLQRYVEHRRGVASRIGIGAGDLDDLFERAQLAFEARLGAGSMVYLRKIFETLTYEVAGIAGVSTEGKKGGRKPFKNLLEEVDKTYRIIPERFSSNGYKLFSELSDVVHGETDENTALEKYPHCKTLVEQLIKNVADNEATKRAFSGLGWDDETAAASSNEEMVS